MNIFVLDRDPEIAAKYHCNKHVVKMILESGQMLCGAHWLSFLHKNGKDLKSFKRVRDAQAWLRENMPKHKQPPWKLSHANHPCSVWTRESKDNYRWHCELGLALCAEYTRRYGKIHKSEQLHNWLTDNVPDIPDIGRTEHPACMPDDCKVDSVVESYKNYYREYKKRLAVWEPRATTPSWFV